MGDESSDRVAIQGATGFDEGLGRYSPLIKGILAEAMSLMNSLLNAAGFVIGEARDEIRIDDGWATVGALIVPGDGVMKIVPRKGIDYFCFLGLAAAAAQVWLYGRSVLTSWLFDERHGWMTLIEIAYVRRPRLRGPANSCLSRSEGIRDRT